MVSDMGNVVQLCECGLPGTDAHYDLFLHYLLMPNYRWKAPDVKDADYLWLPFIEESGKLNITYVDTWKVKDY